MTTTWRSRTSDVEAALRAGGRRRYNRWRTIQTAVRRYKISQWIFATFGLEALRLWGLGPIVARQFGISLTAAKQDLRAIRAPFCRTPWPAMARKKGTPPADTPLSRFWNRYRSTGSVETPARKP